MFDQETIDLIDMIEKAVNFKPKKIKEREEKPDNEHFKPRSDTGIWSIYHSAALDATTDNPYYEERFLEADSYWGVKYATKVKRCRWDKLEEKLLTKLEKENDEGYDCLEQIRTYIERLKIVSAVKFEELVKQKLNSLVDCFEKVVEKTIKDGVLTAYNSDDERMWSTNKIVLCLKCLAAFDSSNEDIRQFGKTICERIVELGMSVIDPSVTSIRNVAVKQEVISNLESVVSVYCSLTKTVSETVEKFLLTACAFRFEQHKQRYSPDVPLHELSDRSTVPFLIAADYFNLVKSRDWPEIIELILKNVSEAPHVAFEICMHFKLKMPVELSEKIFEMLTDNLMAAIEKHKRDSEEYERRYGHRYWVPKYYGCGSEFYKIIKYIDEILKDRSIAFEKLLVKGNVTAVVKDYCKAIKNLAREGNVISKEGSVVV
jgi:hypothetical protein